MSFIYNWYDFIFLGLAALIVYPDKVLGWAGQRSGRTITRWHIAIFEPIAVCVMIAVGLLLMAIHPRFDWWVPIACVGGMGLVRFLYWVGTIVFRAIFDL